MATHGHEVKLIAPQYVRPFVKRQKNDAADAEAIVVAAQRPEMRFITPKAEEQQAQAILFRGRERLVRQRTELVNAHAPAGTRPQRPSNEPAELQGPALGWPLQGYCKSMAMSPLFSETCSKRSRHSSRTSAGRSLCSASMIASIRFRWPIPGGVGWPERIQTKTKQIGALATQTDTARRLQTMPGVGPVSALAVEAFAPPMESFRRGRDFAAWLGLVPRQHSSGGKERLGRISKSGQADIRRLLIMGAMSRLNWLGRKTIPES